MCDGRAYTTVMREKKIFSLDDLGWGKVARLEADKETGCERGVCPWLAR